MAFTPRTLENKPPITYDAAKTRVFFAEDWNDAMGALLGALAWIASFAVSWGSIGGTISDQGDLWGYLKTALYFGSHTEIAGQTNQVAAFHSHTVNASSGAGYYSVGGWCRINSISVDTMVLRVTYTDDGNVARVVNLLAQNTASGVMSATGMYNFMPVTIYAKDGTDIAVDAKFITSGGSINYNANGAYL